MNYLNVASDVCALWLNTYTNRPAKRDNKLRPVLEELNTGYPFGILKLLLYIVAFSEQRYFANCHYCMLQGETGQWILISSFICT